MPSDNISHNGFTCGWGRFYAQGQIERVGGSRLKAMFLPRLTPEANKLLRDHYGKQFVRAQLQHYDVDYDEKELSGNGTLLFKKMLQAGKCDKVPDHIEELRAEMHAEWLDNMSEGELSGHPEWVMEKYFVDGSGQPDTTKTTEVVGIPYELYSNYRTSQLREAASRVGGLYQATGLGSTQTIYLGWDQDAVKKAAKNHGTKEAQANRAKAYAREEERASKHESYLAKAQNSKFGPKVPSPVGEYIIDCEEIEGNWPDLASNMTLAIRGTPMPGIYQASFDFGVVEGLMMLSSDESLLHRFETRQLSFDDENEEDEGDEEDAEDDEVVDEKDSDDSQDESADGKRAVGSKRKAKAKAQSGRPSKQAKTKTVRAGKPSKYFLRLRSRDTGTGEINPTTEKGTIRFGGPGLSSFTGEANMGCIGSGIIFTARKISAVPPKSWESWEDYSEAAYERARVDRWR